MLILDLPIRYLKLDYNLRMEEINQYLDGKKIDSSMMYRPIYSSQKMRDRDSALIEMIQRKRVLHIGFLDHKEALEIKGHSNWLHTKVLPPVSASAHGLDIDEEAIAELISRGFKDLYTWSTFPIENQYEIVLIPDVIEHIENVGDFLNQVHAIDGDNYVFTTPNAFALINRQLLNDEFINSDHLQWFSAWTIRAHLYRSGFIVTNIEMCDNFSKYKPIRSLIKRLIPHMRETMVVTAQKVGSSSR